MDIFTVTLPLGNQFRYGCDLFLPRAELEEGWTVGAYAIAPDPSSPAIWTRPKRGTEIKLSSISLPTPAKPRRCWITMLASSVVRRMGAPEQGIDKLIAVNCTGVTLSARAAHKYLKHTPGAQLVSMASASAEYRDPFRHQLLCGRSDRGAQSGMAPCWDPCAGDLATGGSDTPLADVAASSTRRPGVWLTPEQVANTLWRAVNPKNKWARGKVHHGVSALDKTFYLGLSPAPDRLTRFLTKVVAG